MDYICGRLYFPKIAVPLRVSSHTLFLQRDINIPLLTEGPFYLEGPLLRPQPIMCRGNNVWLPKLGQKIASTWFSLGTRAVGTLSQHVRSPATLKAPCWGDRTESLHINRDVSRAPAFQEPQLLRSSQTRHGACEWKSLWHGPIHSLRRGRNTKKKKKKPERAAPKLRAHKKWWERENDYCSSKLLSFGRICYSAVIGVALNLYISVKGRSSSL